MNKCSEALASAVNDSQGYAPRWDKRAISMIRHGRRGVLFEMASNNIIVRSPGLLL